MSKYNSRLIDDEPADSLFRIRGLLLVYMSLEVDGLMVGAEDGKIALLDEVVAALECVTEQVSELQRKV